MRRSAPMPLPTVDGGASGVTGAPAPSLGRWSCPPPRVDAAKILRVHKYTCPDRVRPIIRDAAQKASESAASLASPIAYHASLPIDSLDGGVLRLGGGIAFTCPAFDTHLGEARRLLAFVMTIGPALDEEVIRLVHDEFEPLDALFLETAGWLTIEAATKRMAADLKRRFAPEGWRLSLRMGPGYDYPAPRGEGRVRWDLTEQRDLFRMFGAQLLPVELMESCAMKPKMSRSGVFGMIPAHAGRQPGEDRTG